MHIDGAVLCPLGTESPQCFENIFDACAKKKTITSTSDLAPKTNYGLGCVCGGKVRPCKIEATIQLRQRMRTYCPRVINVGVETQDAEVMACRRSGAETGCVANVRSKNAGRDLSPNTPAESFE